MDAGLISAGFGMLNGAIAQSGANAVARIQAGASNNIRAINNQTRQHITARNAALTSLQRWAQSVRNSRVTESIERTQEALTTNFNRQRDARTRANFATSTRQAEEQGRFAAAAATSGVTGSVVDVIDMTSRVRNNIQNEQRLAEENQLLLDENQTEFRSRWALLDNMDYSLIFDNPEILDAGTTQAQTGSVVGAAIGGAGQRGLQSIVGAIGSAMAPAPSLSGGASSFSLAGSEGISNTASFSFNPSFAGGNYLSLGTI